ncbi:MAG: hypothetical protein EA351_01540 [Gemmatimonadales bacterium]|nr:MAG: hypothetical protein EA351_01540 [Gemmatimonadales bacterium]
MGALIGGVLGAETLHAQNPPDPTFPIGSEVSPMSESGATLEFELVGELGAADGDGALGRIRDVAVSGDTIAAVLDEFGCLIHLFDLPDGAFRRAIGGCGEGPGELLQPMSIAFVGDTLRVSDVGKRRLLLLDAEGNEVRTVPYPPELGNAPLVQVDARDGLVLWKPHWIGSSPERNLVLAERPGDRMATGVPDPEISYTHPDEARVRAVGGTCAFRDVPRVAVSNRWTVELLILDTALGPHFRHREDGAGFDPEPAAPEYGGGWNSGFRAISGLACADSTALWAFRRYDAEALAEGTLRVERALHLLATSDGVILGRRVVEDTSWPDVATQVPAAGSGDRFYFFQNSWGPYPTVRIYEVELASDGAGRQ